MELTAACNDATMELSKLHRMITNYLESTFLLLIKNLEQLRDETRKQFQSNEELQKKQLLGYSDEKLLKLKPLLQCTNLQNILDDFFLENTEPLFDLPQVLRKISNLETHCKYLEQLVSDQCEFKQDLTGFQSISADKIKTMLHDSQSNNKKTNDDVPMSNHPRFALHNLKTSNVAFDGPPHSRVFPMRRTPNTPYGFEINPLPWKHASAIQDMYGNLPAPANQNMRHLPPTTNCRIICCYLPLNTTDEKLKSLFAQLQLNIVEARMEQGKGYVTFENSQDAQTACDNFDNFAYHGKRLSVSMIVDSKENFQDIRPKLITIPNDADYRSNEESKTCCVFYLPPSVTEKELSTLFQCGNSNLSVVTVKLVKTQCFGYVIYSNAQDAKEAVAKLNNSIYQNKKIAVSIVPTPLELITERQSRV